jgi:hypothetical protein
MRSSVAYLLAFGALSLAACNPILGPTPTDDNWHTRSIGHFTYYVRPDSFAESVLTPLSEVLDDQFSSTVARLNLRYQGHITMFLHNSGSDAGFGNDPGGGDHSGVAYPDTETVKSVCVPPLGGNLFSLLSHEANHVILINGLGRPGTTLMNEGMASAVISERFHSVGPSFYHRWSAERRAQLPRLADLVDDDKWKNYPQQTAYNAGASFLAYVIQVYGPAPLKAVYYSSSSEYPSAFKTAYGKSLEQVEAEWLAFVSGLMPVSD